MKKSILVILPNLQGAFPWLGRRDKAIDTLTAFVRDTEHELISVITALQAHIDLLRDEQVLNQMPVDRFEVLDRAMERLIADTDALASISALALTPRSKKKQIVDTLMQEVVQETRSAFNTSQVSLSCKIDKGTTLFGNAVSLKVLLTRIVLTVLQASSRLETVSVIGLTLKKRVSLTFETGFEANDGVFKPWNLGELRLIPMNGDGMNISTIDAMARLHHGQLSMSTLSGHRHGFKLTFKT